MHSDESNDAVPCVRVNEKISLPLDARCPWAVKTVLMSCGDVVRSQRFVGPQFSRHQMSAFPSRDASQHRRPFGVSRWRHVEIELANKPSERNPGFLFHFHAWVQSRTADLCPNCHPFAMDLLARFRAAVPGFRSQRQKPDVVLLELPVRNDG